MVTATGLRLADALLQFRRGDVLLLLAHDELDTDADEDIAARDGLELPVLLVARYARGPKSWPTASMCTFRVLRSVVGSFGTNGATLALLDALLLAVAAGERARDRSASLTELDEFRHRSRQIPCRTARHLRTDAAGLSQFTKSTGNRSTLPGAVRPP